MQLAALLRAKVLQHPEAADSCLVPSCLSALPKPQPGFNLGACRSLSCLLCVHVDLCSVLCCMSVRTARVFVGGTQTLVLFARCAHTHSWGLKMALWPKCISPRRMCKFHTAMCTST
jgi:hypothetical protein